MLDWQQAMIQKMHAVRRSGQPHGLRLLLPDRRPLLLVHQQPVEHGPAVLHHQADAAPEREEGRGPTRRSPKALAPKPGQKPVRPTRRTPRRSSVADGAPTTVADGTDRHSSPAASRPDRHRRAGDGRVGPTAPPRTARRPARNPPRARSPRPGAKPAAEPAAGAKPAAGATDGAEPPVADDAGGADGPTLRGPGAGPAGQARPRRAPGGAGGRRPQGQRSPTQTRQKKKRR